MQNKLHLENNMKQMELKFMENNSSSVGLIKVKLLFTRIIKIIILKNTYLIIINFINFTEHS